LAAPAERVDALPYGGIAVELTETLDDTEQSWDHFKLIRDRCKDHLDNNVFSEIDVPRGHVYQIPEFRVEGASPER